MLFHLSLLSVSRILPSHPSLYLLIPSIPLPGQCVLLYIFPSSNDPLFCLFGPICAQRPTCYSKKFIISTCCYKNSLYLHAEENMWHLPLCIWVASEYSLIYHSSWNFHSSLLLIKFHCVYVSQSIVHSSIDRNLVWLHCLCFVSRVTVNMEMQASIL